MQNDIIRASPRGRGGFSTLPPRLIVVNRTGGGGLQYATALFLLNGVSR